jgi:very-short-patch-repair endonuclease
VTSPLRTILDLAAVAPYATLRSAVRRAQSEKLIHHRQLARALREWRGRRGIRNLRKIVATGPAPTRSELEDLVYDLIVDGGFQPPEVNKPLVIDGRRLVPDFRWPAQRLIVEADGRKWHDNPVAREDDAERQALLEAHGERVLRVTWEQAVSAPAVTHERIALAGAPERAALARPHRRVSPSLH